MEKNEFTSKVIATIQRIPRGRVATYQQVAGLAGKSLASRGVAWILNSCSKKYKLPWQRVISSKGKISFPRGTRNFALQRRLLRQEGVDVSPMGDVDMDLFQYRKKAAVGKKKNQPRMFS